MRVARFPKPVEGVEVGRDCTRVGPASRVFTAHAVVSHRFMLFLLKAVLSAVSVHR